MALRGIVTDRKPSGAHTEALRGTLPWADEPEDPQVEEANEVIFTAWIKCTVREDIKTKVDASFIWLNANGECAENPDPKAADGGKVEIKGEGGGDPKNPVQTWQSSEQEDGKVLLEFEKSSPPLKCEPKFLRNFVEQQLSITVTYPAPPPEFDEEAPVETPEPLQATVNLPLAPLIMLTEELDKRPLAEKLDISDLICKQIQYDTGILSFQIGVTIDRQLLSDEVANCINPVLVCLEYAKDLPPEIEYNQKRDAVVGSISVFGQKIDSPATVMTDDGYLEFNHYKVFFVGKWLQHHLREYLQTVAMQVEIHDRDGEQPEMQEGDEEPPPPPEKFPHGRATFSLWELLNPLIKTSPQPLSMRADLLPVVRNQKERKGGIGDNHLHANTLFTEETKELLASMQQKQREYAPSYAPHQWLPPHGTDQFGYTGGHNTYYRPGGAYVEVHARIAKPLPSPDAIKKLEETAAAEKAKAAEEEAAAAAAAAAKGQKGAPPPAEEEEERELDLEEEAKEDLTHERFGRVVLVIDYKKTTIVKKLLALVVLNNTRVMKMEDGPSRAVATRQLTDEEKADVNLDILTGFIMMDRKMRIVLIEGLRSGAMNEVVECIGRPQANNNKWKLLYHPDCGFSERRYANFDLTLKQIKLRQQSLELLMQRPDLYDVKKTEMEVIAPLQCLMDMKRAERIHVLKRDGSFPVAGDLITIETQYGDFVTDAELEGGCAEDESSTKGSTRGGTSVRSSPKAQKTMDKTQLPDEESDEEMDNGDETAPPIKKQRIIKKAQVDQSNADYENHLLLRSQEGYEEDKIRLNKKMVKSASDTLALNNPNKKPIDKSFLEGQPVYIYSGQKLCTTELQKAHLRAKMAEQEQTMMWTYSPEYNSGCFPMIPAIEGIEQQLRQVPADETSAQHPVPFRYPKQRPLEDYKKLGTNNVIMDVSDTRKWELKNENAPWQENEWHGRISLKTDIVRGAFDSYSTGSRRQTQSPPVLEEIVKVRRRLYVDGPKGIPPNGSLDELELSKDTTITKRDGSQTKGDNDYEPQIGANVINTRTRTTRPKEKTPAMKHDGRFRPARPNLVDKYFTQIRDGDHTSVLDRLEGIKAQIQKMKGLPGAKTEVARLQKLAAALERDGKESHSESLRFDKRRPEHWMQKMEDLNMYPEGTTAKYGRSCADLPATLETLPSSYQHHEEFHQGPRNSNHPFQMAKDCSKEVAPYGPGVLSNINKSKMHILNQHKRADLDLKEPKVGVRFVRAEGSMKKTHSLPTLKKVGEPAKIPIWDNPGRGDSNSRT